MAIYHFAAKIISRAHGRSAVAAAAYRSGAALYDERLSRTHDFTAKHDVIHSEILLPDSAPPRWRDRAMLWNEVEAVEKRRDAQLAREIEFALPRELSRGDGIALARGFVEREFVSRGMVADVNVHCPSDDDGNPKPHVHVMLTMREAGRQGFGVKVRDWNATAELQHWREAWADMANARLAELGHDLRIDHRSFEAQGIDLEPQNKIGPAGSRRIERGESAERAAEHRAIARRNGERIADEPEIALRTITYEQSTFTRRDLARFLHRHSDGPEQFTNLMAKVQASPELVAIHHDSRSEARFTTREMIAVEARLARSADALGAQQHHAVDDRHVAAALRHHQLGSEQQAALAHVTAARGLTLVVGYAGTGKSAMLGSARAVWERQGYRVHGATLSGIAADSLEAGSGIESRTLASLERSWSRGFDQLTSRDVLVIDEAGLIGSRQLERVLTHAREAQAKIVLVGDPEQLQAIEAGAAFRALVERLGAVELTDVRRQRVDWHRQATVELATGRTGEALARYAESGSVVEHASHRDARRALVERWMENGAAAGSSVMLAFTRDDVRALNALARDRMRDAGRLGSDVDVMTANGERRFAVGDSVMFLKNERGLGVKNGTLGTVSSVSEHQMVVAIGSQRRKVAFELQGYAHVDHGYAATIHKAQGVTVDRTFVLASAHMDRHATYVALSRHRDGVELHYGRDEIAGSMQLVRLLGRERAKDTTLDYGATDGIVDRTPLWRQMSELIAGRFDGLNLGSDERLGSRQQRADPPAPRSSKAALEKAAEAYAIAWRETRRMRDKNLPVLPHQRSSLEHAGAALDRLAPGTSTKLHMLLKRDPAAAFEKDRGADLLAAAKALQPECQQPSMTRARWRGRERDQGLEL